MPEYSWALPVGCGEERSTTEESTELNGRDASSATRASSSRHVAYAAWTSTCRDGVFEGAAKAAPCEG